MSEGLRTIHYTTLNPAIMYAIRAVLCPYFTTGGVCPALLNLSHVVVRTSSPLASPRETQVLESIERPLIHAEVAIHADTLRCRLGQRQRSGHKLVTTCVGVTVEHSLKESAPSHIAVGIPPPYLGEKSSRLSEVSWFARSDPATVPMIRKNGHQRVVGS